MSQFRSGLYLPAASGRRLRAEPEAHTLSEETL